jgi:hypothetical protein
MTDAPERIWLTADDPNNRPFVTKGPLASPPRTEYIRADLVPGWQPIETAPRDGTRVMLWRGFTEIGKWAEMVVAEWHDGEWQWPSDDNPSTHGEWTVDDMLNGYCSCGDFTHWMPLPNPPGDTNA